MVLWPFHFGWLLALVFINRIIYNFIYVCVLLIIQLLRLVGRLVSRKRFNHTVPVGSGSVILLRPKMGLVPPKHDVIIIPIQQYKYKYNSNTKHIPMERYHPEVSIMLIYMNQIKRFSENLCYCKVKIDKMFWVTYRTFLSNATTFRNDCGNRRIS